MRNLASRTEPLRALLRKENEWSWGQAQRKAFQEIKDCLVSTETLCHYDPNRLTVIAADACMNGLGAVLLQKQLDGTSRPVCYASRSLSDTEQRYAVIEKEALAATWACEKFRDFVTGLDFELQTDHKPLVPLLSSKDLSQMPPRILRFRMRMMRFAPTVVHVPGKDQITADALSRAPVDGPDSRMPLWSTMLRHSQHKPLTFCRPARRNCWKSETPRGRMQSYAKSCSMCRPGGRRTYLNSPS